MLKGSNEVYVKDGKRETFLKEIAKKNQQITALSKQYEGLCNMWMIGRFNTAVPDKEYKPESVLAFYTFGTALANLSSSYYDIAINGDQEISNKLRSCLQFPNLNAALSRPEDIARANKMSDYCDSLINSWKKYSRLKYSIYDKNTDKSELKPVVSLSVQEKRNYDRMEHTTDEDKAVDSMHLAAICDTGNDPEHRFLPAPLAALNRLTVLQEFVEVNTKSVIDKLKTVKSWDTVSVLTFSVTYLLSSLDRSVFRESR